MSINDILKKYSKIEIELLLAHVLKKPKEFIFLYSDNNLTIKQFNNLQRLVKRRMRGEPIAYILGYKDFYGLRFKVNRDVLIPRPETEVVVDLVLAKLRSSPLLSGDVALATERLQYNRLRNNLSPALLSGGEGALRGSPIKILDIGTGSGAIIISLAHYLKTFTNVKSFKLYGSDISVKALAVARRNAKAHGAKIKFIHSDILENVRMSPDIIIANLPYLDPKWKDKSIQHEPKQALFAKEGGLYLYRKLLQQVSTLTPQPSTLFLEIDPRQKRTISVLIKKHLPGAGVTFHRDYANRWRYAEVEVRR